MTTGDHRPRLVLHGAVVLLVGLLCGLPTVSEDAGGVERHWHTAHEALIMMGVWMFAAAGILPALVLPQREQRALIWSLLLMGYGFATALVVGGIAGVSAFQPGNSPVNVAAFVAATAGILGAVMAALITLRGAHAATKASQGS